MEIEEKIIIRVMRWPGKFRTEVSQFFSVEEDQLLLAWDNSVHVNGIQRKDFYHREHRMGDRKGTLCCDLIQLIHKGSKEKMKTDLYDEARKRDFIVSKHSGQEGELAYSLAYSHKNECGERFTSGLHLSNPKPDSFVAYDRITFERVVWEGSKASFFRELEALCKKKSAVIAELGKANLEQARRNVEVIECLT